MKTILVPTDFSETSINAIEYAAELANLTKAKIILFHVYHVPFVTNDVSVMMPSTLDEMEGSSLRDLKNIQKSICLKYGHKFKVECKCVCGFAVEEINFFTKENKIDLIVMGMQGAGYLEEQIIGSITTSLISKGSCPVLAIAKKVKFRNIKKIVLACDYLGTNDKLLLEPLKEFARLFKSHISILNVIRELGEVPTLKKAVGGIKLEHLLEDINHTFHYAKNEDVVEGINEFVSEQRMDMVVMIPHLHSLLENIFQEPNTKKMAFHTTIPLLALHTDISE